LILIIFPCVKKRDGEGENTVGFDNHSHHFWVMSGQQQTLCFFTVVMNRLHHLEQTLPENIAANNQDTTRFLVLDYNSTDGLQEYILKTFPKELKHGKLEYHRYAHAKYFSHSHSRNLAASLTNAPYICNLDADNFTGPQFDEFLQEKFSQHPRAVISALSNSFQVYGAFGRMATRREHFNEVGGYDEAFDGYGFEDYDLVSRLEQHGLEKVLIDEEAHLRTVSHDNNDRVAREWTHDQLATLYRQQVSDNMQVLLYLFKDHSMHYGIVNEDFAAGVHYRYSLAGNKWQKGTWKESGENILIRFEGFDAEFEKKGPYLTGNNHYMKAENDAEKLQEAVLFHTNMANCCRYLQNKERNKIRVNENGFGHGKTESLLIH